MVFPTLVLGRMKEYVDDPETFKPDRWLKQTTEGNNLHPFASLPYGHGPRMCLGRRFADLEMQILLCKVCTIVHHSEVPILTGRQYLLFSILKEKNI